jgi:hypothetical protein
MISPDFRPSGTKAKRSPDDPDSSFIPDLIIAAVSRMKDIPPERLVADRKQIPSLRYGMTRRERH